MYQKKNFWCEFCTVLLCLPHQTLLAVAGSWWHTHAMCRGFVTSLVWSASSLCSCFFQLKVSTSSCAWQRQKHWEVNELCSFSMPGEQCRCPRCSSDTSLNSWCRNFSEKRAEHCWAGEEVMPHHCGYLLWQEAHARPPVRFFRSLMTEVQGLQRYYKSQWMQE